MSCEHLVCARCGNPVVQARCPACRAARDEFHQRTLNGAQTLLVAALLLAVALLVALRLTVG